MGRLADLAMAAGKAGPTQGPAAASLRSRYHWREVFGRIGNATIKEDRLVTDPSTATDPTLRPVPGGSYGRGISNWVFGPAFKRLLEAMRSMAPGGWSDDRWQETKSLVSIAYVAITAKCRIVSQSEFQVFRKDRNSPDGKRPVMEHEDPKAHELIRLLEKPNPQDTFGMMCWRWMQQMDLTGTALTWMVPNELKTPMEIYCVPTAIAIPQPAVNPDFPDGYYRIQPVYPYGPFSSYPTPASAVGAPIPAQWMLRFQYPHPLLRYDGYSPLTGVRLEMDELNMVNRSRHYSMRKAINPSAALDLSNVEDAQHADDSWIDRLRTELENTFYGPENAGGIIVPPPGGKVEPWGASPIDMDYPQGWDQLTNFLLAAFGITKPAAGMVDDSSYSTLYATLKQLDVLTLQPWRDNIAALLTRNLARFFGDDLIIEIRGKRIDDHDIKNQKLQMLCQNKAIKINELRKELDMPLIEEDWGEERVGAEQNAGAPGMGGMPGSVPGMPGEAPGQPAEAGGMLDQAIAEKAPEGGEAPLDEAIEQSRPRPGNLGEGSLGPRDSLKALQGRFKHLTGKPQRKIKSLYDQMREVCANGH